MQTELSNPVTFQMRLPKPVLERMKQESEEDMIPLTLLARKCIIRTYGGDSVLPSDSTERTESAQKVHQADEESNG